MTPTESKTICSSCGLGGDHHSDDGKCMNAYSRQRMREEWRRINEIAAEAVGGTDGA